MAGAVAGLALLLDSKSRRIAVALYLSTRAVQCAWLVLVERGVIPTFKHGNTVLMGVLNMQIIYSFLCHPDTLSRPYYEWIYNLADRQFFYGRAMARTVMACLGSIARGQPVPAEVLRPLLDKSRAVYALAQSAPGLEGTANNLAEVWLGNRHQPLSEALLAAAAPLSDTVSALVDNPMVPHRHVFCALVHPDSTSCTWSSLKYTARCFPMALRMYVPLNAAMLLLFRHALLASKYDSSLYHMHHDA